MDNVKKILKTHFPDITKNVEPAVSGYDDLVRKLMMQIKHLEHEVERLSKFEQKEGKKYKPCPFCGNENINYYTFKKDSECHAQHYIECWRCEATVSHFSKEDVDILWNSRAS